MTYLTDQLDTSNRANLCSFFWWTACLFLPRALSFGFCYDLDLCSQGQALRAFFIGMGSPNFVKCTRGILIKLVRKVYRQVAHDLIIVDL